MFWWWKKRLSAAQLWGLAAGGVLARVNRASFTQIRLDSDSDDMRYSLQEAYGIEDVKGLHSVREWLLQAGHREPCMELCRQLRDGNDDPHDERLQFVNKNFAQLQQSQLHGFDLSRLVMLARFGLNAKYINEAEAWDWIMDASVKLQKHLNSWRELGEDFVLGCEFLALSGGYDIDDRARQAFRWLMKSPKSPWAEIDWETPLV